MKLGGTQKQINPIDNVLTETQDKKKLKSLKFQEKMKKKLKYLR